MSDQDDISRLLGSTSADQTAQDAPSSEEPVVAPARQSASPLRRVRHARDNGDILGVSWLFGSMHAVLIRRQKSVKEWSSTEVVRTVEEFETAIDLAMAALGFQGTEMFLLLENEHFSHQTETAPASPDAARAYLKRHIERMEKEHEPVLWVSQPAVEVRQEQSYLLHVLPSSFYDQLNRVLLARRLDLTRILPLVVPLHRELNKMPIGKDTPMLLVADIGQTTAVMVGRVGGPLLFYRTILADLNAEPARVGVEVNRSILYAKQQFGCAVDHVWILARNGKAAAQVQAKCGASKRITVLPTTPIDWLQTAIKLPARQPVNLLAGYLRRKRRRLYVRLALLAAAWGGLAAVGYDQWTQREALLLEQGRIAELRSNEPALRAERDRLQKRNTALQRDRAVAREVLEEKLPPVSEKFLRFLGTVTPANVRLTECSVRFDPTLSPQWQVRLEGVIEGDESVGRQTLNTLQTKIERGPFRANFNEAARSLTAFNLGGGAGQIQRFVLEGGLLEL